MIVKDIMSTDVAWVRSDDSVEKAAQLMKQHNVGSIPVCNQNSLVGIVTDRDIALRSVASDQDARQQQVSSVMSTDCTVGSPDMNVNDAAQMMSERQIRRLPIVENNNLVGIVALGDISLEPSSQSSAENALKNISKP
ncbi:CBS domain-containing protein [Anaerosacchariphilus polymeriproducens]|uniref:CBS domain-containing protein n=1 Tax=Anaerosacchariphilus polymeriproducens TaxID=1812858 RepID=A0A371AYE2_9FIRM|nr:CBS domain-containing protein [Anaerosacchariphilus polymeriproducens]RDU24615.1 CBS domain-containing protein [Anaerosacchariphilus polymeriproducens]